VLKPGGRVRIADIVLATPAAEACRSNPQLWAECVVGAVTEQVYVGYLRDAGLRDVEVLHRFDYLSGSSSAETRRVAGSLGACALVLRPVRRVSAARSQERVDPATATERMLAP
jgi:arsenite methyltransferase